MNHATHQSDASATTGHSQGDPKAPAPPAPPAGSPGLIHQVPGLEDAGGWASAYLSPVRLEILMHLFVSGEQAVIEIANALALDRSSISHALSRLRDDALVHVRSIDRRRLYSITDRVEIEYTDARFTLTITRKDGWSVNIERKTPSTLDKPTSDVEAKPKSDVVVRAVNASTTPRERAERVL